MPLLVPVSGVPLTSLGVDGTPSQVLMAEADKGDTPREAAARLRAMSALMVNALVDCVLDPQGGADGYAKDLLAASERIFKTSKKGVITDVSGVGEVSSREGARQLA